MVQFISTKQQSSNKYVNLCKSTCKTNDSKKLINKLNKNDILMFIHTSCIHICVYFYTFSILISEKYLFYHTYNMFVSIDKLGLC